MNNIQFLYLCWKLLDQRNNCINYSLMRKKSSEHGNFHSCFQKYLNFNEENLLWNNWVIYGWCECLWMLNIELVIRSDRLHGSMLFKHSRDNTKLLIVTLAHNIQLLLIVQQSSFYNIINNSFWSFLVRIWFHFLCKVWK